MKQYAARAITRNLLAIKTKWAIPTNKYGSIFRIEVSGTKYIDFVHTRFDTIIPERIVGIEVDSPLDIDAVFSNPKTKIKLLSTVGI